ATTWGWTRPSLVWKLPGALMAKGKGDKDDKNGAPEHDLVAMARGLAEIVAAHGLSELIVDTKETTMTIRRGAMVATPLAMAAAPPGCAAPPPRAAPIAIAAPAAIPTAVPAVASAPTPAVDDKSHTVTSPFVGTFYRKPNPDSPSYVSMNERVEKGQVLCIVEA